MGGFTSFFQSRLFDPQWKTKVLVAQVVLTVLLVILGIAKAATRPSYIPMTRNDIMAITMVRRTILTALTSPASVY